MDKKPLLSICIPTYNRLGYLLDNLSHLLPQIREHKNVIELIISDNHSQIDPFPEISGLCARYGIDFNYIRHENNIGGDQNIRFVLNIANGDYLFVLGDDDILSPNFIGIILPILKTHEYGAIHYGRLIGDENCSNNRMHNMIFDDTLLCLSANDFIKRYLSMPNFISSIIIDRECWERGSRVINRNYYGYNWFAAYYFGIIEVSKPCMVYYFPLVIMRNPARVWSKLWPLYAVVGLGNLFKDIDVLIPGIYDLWIKRLHDVRYYELRRILRQVYPYKDFYQKKKDEFFPHLTKTERAYFNYWLYTPIPKISNKVVELFKG